MTKDTPQHAPRVAISPVATIPYTLQACPPRVGEPLTYGAHAKIKPISLNALIEEMARGQCRYAPYEIKLIMAQMMNAIIHHLRQGDTVNLGSMLRLRPAIRGHFNSPDEDFNPTKHELIVAVSAGNRLRNALM